MLIDKHTYRNTDHKLAIVGILTAGEVIKTITFFIQIFGTIKK